MKKIIALTTVSLLSVGAAQAASYEYYQLYKDPKIMGAGGANVASGGSFSAVFSNPAGLSRIPKEYGWEFQLLNVSVAYNEDVSKLTDIVDAAGEGTGEISDVLDELIGKKIHLGMSAVPFSVAKKFDKNAFGAGVVTNMTTTLTVNNGLGEKGPLEADIFTASGAVFGFSRDLPDMRVGRFVLNRIAVGGGLKAISYGSLSRDFKLYELEDPDFEMEDEIKEGSSTVADLGVIYNLTPRLAMGVSVLNIGGIGDENGAHIPMTVNIGGAYTYEIAKRTFFNRVKLAADYIDIAGGYEDDSYIKRTRLGADLNVWDGWASSFSMQAGLYQGAYTAGLNLRMALLEIGLATYAEEMGAYAGQDSDRRYIASLGLSW